VNEGNLYLGLVFIFNNSKSFSSCNVCGNISFLVLDYNNGPLVWNAFLDTSFCKFDLEYISKMLIFRYFSEQFFVLVIKRNTILEKLFLKNVTILFVLIYLYFVIW
jgi:hypothetical protein